MRAALIAQFDGEPQIQARNAIALPLLRSRFGLNCSSKPMPFNCRLSVETPMTLAASLGLGLEMGFDPAILIREGVLLASLVTLFLLTGIAVLVVRTRSLPVCWNCGYSAVRRSQSHESTVDTLARLCFVRSYRCDKCLRRFYAFRSRRVLGHSGGRLMAAGKG